MYAGMSKENPELDEIVYFAINAHWEDALIELPSLPTGYVWKLYFDTGRAPEEVITEDKNILLYDRRYRMSGRTVLAAVAEKVY